MEEEKCCSEEDCCCEEMSVEDVAHHADDKVDALIELLIKKKIITEKEFTEEFQSLFEDDEDS